MVAFAKGAYSFPYDWWLCLHWIAGMQGLYGDDMQRRCRRVGLDIDVMINMARSGLPLTYKAATVVVKDVLQQELTRCTTLDVALQRIDRRPCPTRHC